MKKIALLIILLVIIGVTLIYTDHSATHTVNAQNKGRITGEVYVREDDEGKKSLLVAVGNECKDKKKPCEKQPIDKVKLTFEDIDFSEPFEIPKIPKFEDSEEYKDFLKALEKMKNQNQKAGGEKSTYGIDDEAYKWFMPIPFPTPMRQPPGNPSEKEPLPDVEWNSFFFDNVWKGDAEKDGDKLILEFGYRYDSDDFQPSYGLKVKVDINDPKFDKALNKRVKIEVENNGKKVFDKKVKPQELPRIEVQNKPVEELNLPNVIHSGEDGIFSFDPIRDFIKENEESLKTFDKLNPQKKLAFVSTKVVLWIEKIPRVQMIKKNAQDAIAFGVENSDNETVKKYNPFVRTIIGVKRKNLTASQLNKKPNDNVGTKTNKVTASQLNKKPNDNVGTKTNKVTASQLNKKLKENKDCEKLKLPSKDCKPKDSNNDLPKRWNPYDPLNYYRIPGELTNAPNVQDYFKDQKVGITIYNDFGEKLAEIEMPDIKIFTEQKNDKNDSEDSGVKDDEETDDVGNKCFLSDYQANRYVLQGRKLCVCGCFFNNDEGWDSIFTSFTLDGKPIVPKAASSSTISFLIPQDTSPGLHKITYKTPDGKTKTVEFRVLAVQGTIDQNRLWTGQGTTMTLQVLGTDRSMPLLIENKTPAIIGITGGDRQVINTSGGENNQVQRQVLGLSRGDFIIDFSLNQPPCPCFQDK